MGQSYYSDCMSKLNELIPRDEYEEIMSQDKCELSCDFLGFIDIYRPLSMLIPTDCIVIDFGCYLAAQSYFFTKHKQYIGVDVITMKRFTPQNAIHYVCSIQDFIKNDMPTLLAKHDNDNLKFFAICSYVPDFEATELVKRVFKNVCCYYPGRINYGLQMDR